VIAVVLLAARSWPSAPTSTVSGTWACPTGRSRSSRGSRTPLGYELHSVAEVTEIDAADAEALTIYATLDEGISANSREEANAIVDQMRTDVSAAKPPTKGANA